MAGTLNKVMLIGHLGDDVKMTYFDGGGSVGRFPIATNEEYVNKTTGEKVSNTEWHNIVVRNKAAEVCEKYLKKGDKIYVEGRIKTRKWQDNQGIERYSTDIQCNEFVFLPSGSASSGNTQGGYGQGSNSQSQQTNSTPQSQSPASNPEANNFPGEEEDDLPF